MIRRIVDWPFWPELTIIVGWTGLAPSPASLPWWSVLPYGLLLGLVGWYMVGRSIGNKLLVMLTRRERR